jgi:plastocyanin
MGNTFHKAIGWALGFGAVVFVLLLGGFFSGALTDDPPAVDPYASRSSDESDVFETDAYASGDTGATDTTADTATSSTATATGPAQITIEGFDFGSPISVEVGQTITVVNRDGATHTWTSRSGAFDSGNIAGGGTFETSIDTAGTYEFLCAIHPSMTGSINVGVSG